MNMNSTSKLTRQWRRISGGWLYGAAAGMTMVFCGCDTTTYDMHQLDQPVVVNGNPFLNSPSAPAPRLTAVDEYDAEVGFSQMVASAGNGTSSQITKKNNAQLVAFSKIGGQDNRLIRNLSFDADFKAFNGLMVLASHISITVTGEVSEIPRPVVVPAPKVTVAAKKVARVASTVTTNTKTVALATNTLTMTNKTVTLTVSTVTTTTNTVPLATNAVATTTTPVTMSTNTVLVPATTNFVSAKPDGAATNQIHSP